MNRYVCGASCQQDICAVHGFAQVVYDVDENARLDTEFRLNVKGMTRGTMSQPKQLALQVRLCTACVVSSLKHILPCSKL